LEVEGCSLLRSNALDIIFVLAFVLFRFPTFIRVFSLIFFCIRAFILIVFFVEGIVLVLAPFEEF